MSKESQELVEMTPKAAEEAENLVEDRGLDGYGIRLGIDYQSGRPSFTLEFAKEPAPDDEVTESEGFPIYVEGESAAAISGSKIDYVVEDGREGFTVVPPQQNTEADYDEDTVEGRIRAFLARNFPQIKGHGGEAIIQELDEEDEYVKLSLEGACSGCGISDATAQAIQTKMPQSVEGIRKVEIDAGDDDEHIDIDAPF